MRLVSDAIAALGIPILGAIPRTADLVLPERHLGLVQANEHGDLAQRLARLAEIAARHLDLEAIRRLAAPPRLSTSASAPVIAPPGQRIALAADAASASSIRMSSTDGARGGARSRPSRRSPTRRRPSIATVAGCPGATPSFTRDCLAAAERFRAGLARFAATRPVHGSAAATWCSAKASSMATGRATHGRAARSFDQLRCAEASSRLSRGDAARREPLGEAGTRLRGHEFHYAALVSEGSDEPLLELADGEGRKLGASGGRRGNVTGAFFHAIARA